MGIALRQGRRLGKNQIMVMKIYSVDDLGVVVPEHASLLAFSEQPDGGLECQVATYNPKPYVRWHTPEGKPVLHVVYWARPRDMLTLIHGS